MPIVAHNDLPTFERLREEGQTIIKPDRARHQTIRELHIGVLNMMPDAALAATERQFFRLVGESNPIAQFYMHPFTLQALPRGEQARAHIEAYYDSFEQICTEGLDALIITGANVTHPDLSQETFWEPLREVFDWAQENVTSVLCSCLATHAAMQFQHGQKRHALSAKLWGVFPHTVIRPTHPLVNDVNTQFDVPHSRYNDISRQALENAGLTILADSEEGGVHMAVSPDQFRFIYMQGHPEYDINSLLKEYKREVLRFLAGELHAAPPFPAHYFSSNAAEVAERFVEQAIQARSAGQSVPEFLEKEIGSKLDNTWGDTAKAIVNNWLGLVYQLTNLDRKKQFMSEVDPDDPLKLRSRGGNAG